MINDKICGIPGLITFGFFRIFAETFWNGERNRQLRILNRLMNNYDVNKLETCDK